nr:reverse transcriptase domain-containing protein [Tanacetum cinerariifolium]
NAQGWVYAVGNAEKNGNAPTNPDSHVVTHDNDGNSSGYDADDEDEDEEDEEEEEHLAPADFAVVIPIDELAYPLNFKGNEGVVGLTRWIEKMESVFNISGCAIENQVKFATCTLLDAALTWWNSQIRTLGPEAYAMT